MPLESGNIQVGPGLLYAAAVGSSEPATLIDAWPAAWHPIGYTTEGSTQGLEQEFEDIVVAEELEPVATVQTSRTATVSFDAAEFTARNLQLALNGGTITPGSGFVDFEPPDAGEVTEVAIGWDAGNGGGRVIWRRCINVGSAEIAHRKAPDLASIAMEFRALIPENGSKPWKARFPDSAES